jgi:formylglycine-generating enzyme required for sulfatase activity
MRTTAAAVVTCLVANATLAFAQTSYFTDPNSGVEFSRIGSVNNAAYSGQAPFNLSPVGRGSVGYEYSIGRFEVTTAQWVEFYNAVYARPDAISFPAQTLWTPTIWGAVRDTSYTGPGTRYRVNPNVANAGMLPVGGISWRTAAVYCNWLHNNKSSNASAFLNGAYDVSTFSGGFPTFTDQAAHNVGARYWIPTWDEWLKAAHYDPNKLNSDGSTGGWWTYSTTSDLTPIYGPPAGFPGGSAANQANSGFATPTRVEYTIPLGAYENVQSPWGLFDVAGGTYEWTESVYNLDGSRYRIIDGSSWAIDPIDAIYAAGADQPNLPFSNYGLRLASSVPSPGPIIVVLTGAVFATRRRRS